MSANVGDFLVTLIGACDLDVQGTRLFHNVLTNPGPRFSDKTETRMLLQLEAVVEIRGKMPSVRSSTQAPINMQTEKPLVVAWLGERSILSFCTPKAPSSFGGGCLYGRCPHPSSGMRSKQPGFVHKNIEALCIKCQTAGKVWMFWRFHQNGLAADTFGIGYSIRMY